MLCVCPGRGSASSAFGDAVPLRSGFVAMPRPVLLSAREHRSPRDQQLPPSVATSASTLHALQGQALTGSSCSCAIQEKEHRNGLRASVSPRVACTVLHDDIAALEMNGLGVIKLQPNLAVVHYCIVDGVGLVHCRIFFFKVIS